MDPHAAPPVCADDLDIVPVDADALLGEYRQAVRRCSHTYRAALGFVGVVSEEQMFYLLDRVATDLDSGEFFAARIGLVGKTDPDLVMALAIIRMRWIEEYQATSFTERFLIDQVLLAFYHQLRIHELIGNVTARAEQMFFSAEPMRVVYGRDGITPQYEVDEHCKRLGEQLLPLLERCQRMVLRALRDLRKTRSPAPCNIRHAEQVNLAHQQLHVHQREGGLPGM